jgi:hypothetical protein
MWRRIVAIARGGNFGGAMWQRPQFAWNLFSPSSRKARLSWIPDAVAASGDEAGLSVEAGGELAGPARAAICWFEELAGFGAGGVFF